MNDLVSIIMPSYNTANYIADSIQSVINQTYSNWELIIVDDCSSDNSTEIIESFHDSRIQLLINSHNSGAAVSRNYALREAKGRWIAFLDSDDLWHPNKLKLQIEFMECNGYSFSYTNYEEIDSNGNPLGIVVTGPRVITKTGFYNYCWPGCLTVMYDRYEIGLVQVPDIKKNNDYAMWLKICDKKKCYLLDKELALYRRGRSGSISSTSITSMIKWHYLLFKFNLEFGFIKSIFNTVRNLIFGLIKKIVFVKRVKK